MFYTTKKAEKTLAAAALTKFACQLFWAANEAETEDWFTWFATRVKMTEKQFAREVERRGGEVEMTAEVQQAIATLAGKSFHMPPHPPSTKHVPSATKPVPQHPTADGEDDAKMEETPTNDGEDMDQGTSSSFFLFFFLFSCSLTFKNTVSNERKRFEVSYPTEEEQNEAQPSETSNNENSGKRERRPRPPVASNHHSDHRPSRGYLLSSYIIYYTN